MLNSGPGQPLLSCKPCPRLIFVALYLCALSMFCEKENCCAMSHILVQHCTLHCTLRSATFFRCDSISRNTLLQVTHLLTYSLSHLVTELKWTSWLGFQAFQTIQSLGNLWGWHKELCLINIFKGFTGRKIYLGEEVIHLIEIEEDNHELLDVYRWT